MSGGGGLQVPHLAFEEGVVLGRHLSDRVVGDVHEVGRQIPGVDLNGVEGQLLPEGGPRRRLGGRQPAGDRRRVAQVQAGHEVGEGVVVDDRRVLVGPGDPVDVEPPVLAVEAQVLPHPGRLDQDLRTGLQQEAIVAPHVDIPLDGVGDVGVEVVLGRARLVVGRRLLAVDRAPRERRSPLAEVGRPLPGLGQHAVAEPQQVPGRPGLGVGQEGQDVGLGVPEVVPVVGPAGQPLGRDAGPLGPPAGLAELEQVPAHGLLHAHGHRARSAVLDDDVGPVPEPVQVLPLGGAQRVEPVAPDPGQRPPAAVAQLLGGHRPRGLVGGVLHDPQRHVGLGVGGQDQLGGAGADRRGYVVPAGDVDVVVDADGQGHPAVRRPVAQHDPTVAALGELLLQDVVVEPAAEPGILVAGGRPARAVAEDAGDDHHRRPAVDRHLV